MKKNNRNYSHFYIGQNVKYKKDKNPNSVDVIYSIKDFNVYVEGEQTMIKVDIQPIKDYPTKDGTIRDNYIHEANLADLETV